MGARLNKNPRRTKIGHVEAFPVLHMRSLRKSAMFGKGQRTEGHFRYPGASNAITIIVDLRSEHDLKVLLKFGHADSATNMQVIGLTHRPTGFNRTHGCTDQACDVKISLANPPPSTHGTFLTWRDVRLESAMPFKADIGTELVPPI